MLWNDPGGFDVYRTHRRFEPDRGPPSRAPDRHARFGSFRRALPEEMAERVRTEGWGANGFLKVLTGFSLAGHDDAESGSGGKTLDPTGGDMQNFDFRADFVPAPGQEVTATVQSDRISVWAYSHPTAAWIRFNQVFWDSAALEKVAGP